MLGALEALASLPALEFGMTHFRIPEKISEGHVRVAESAEQRLRVGILQERLLLLQPVHKAILQLPVLDKALIFLVGFFPHVESPVVH